MMPIDLPCVVSAPHCRCCLFREWTLQDARTFFRIRNIAVSSTESKGNEPPGQQNMCAYRLAGSQIAIEKIEFPVTSL